MRNLLENIAAMIGFFIIVGIIIYFCLVILNSMGFLRG